MLADFRYALRQLRKSPAFTIVAVLTLALGIGATTAIFTLVQQVMLQSLPVSRPDQLWRIGDQPRCCNWDGYSQNGDGEPADWSLFPWEAYKLFRANTPGFQDLAALQADSLSLAVRRAGSSGQPDRVYGQYVSGNFFETLGSSAWRGRLLTDADDREGAPPVAVMSFHAWQEKYGSDPSVVGSTYQINGHAFTIIGVAPAGFVGAKMVNWGMPDIWMPMATEPILFGKTARMKSTRADWLDLIGRVRPETNPKALQAQLQSEQDALNAAKQQRVYLETLVNQYRTLQGSSKSSASGAPAGLPAIDAELDKLKSQLADLSSRYTDRHPDVRKLKEQIAKEEKTRDQIIAGMQAKSSAPADGDALPEPADPRDPSPLAQLQGQLHANKLEVANREHSTAELKAKIADYQSRLNQEPVREQQLSDLTRGYDQSKANYDELLKKRNDSAMATSMELLQQGGRFRMVDPPNLPTKPAFPNRLKFCGIGIGVGLILGLVVVGTFEFLDDRIYDEKELQELLPVPVMSEIPDMVSPSDQEKRERRVWLGWATAAVVSFTILAGSAISYLRG